jgi:hypothetical protein
VRHGAVSPALAGQIFGPPQQQGAGLIQPWLYARANWTVVAPTTIGESNQCKIVY